MTTSPAPTTPDDDPEREAELIRQAIAGEESALEELLVERHEALWRYLDHRVTGPVREKVGTEDLLQQTYLQAFKSIRGFEPRGPGSFLAWLKTIATRKLIDASRSRGREQRAAKPADSTGGSGYVSLMARVADSCAGPDGDAMAEELRGAFHVAMEGLADNYRMGIQLRYLEGLSLEEVAERLGVSPDAARGVCHRARKALRDEIMRLSRFV